MNTMKHISTLTLFLVGFILLVGCNTTDNNAKLGEMNADQAIEVLSVKLHKNSKDHRLYYQRARMYMQVGRVNDAIADLKKATQFKKDDEEYLTLLADAYFANGDVQNSYKTLGRVLELDPDNKEAVLKQGEISYAMKDYDRALASLSKVTELDPGNQSALAMKAFVYKEKGDTASAIILLRRLCDLYPDNSMAFEELGVLYANRQYPLAVEYLQAAIRLSPSNPNPVYALAMFYQERGKMTEAEELYKQVLDIDANHKYAWHNRGYIELFHYGDAETAIDYFSRAIQCDSLFAEAYANRGWAYDLYGDKRLAEQDFLSALNIQRDFQPALDGLKDIGK